MFVCVFGGGGLIARVKTHKKIVDDCCKKPIMTMEVWHEQTFAEGPLKCRGRPKVSEDGRVGAPGVAVNKVIDIFNVDPNHWLNQSVGSDPRCKQIFDAHRSVIANRKKPHNFQ